MRRQHYFFRTLKGRRSQASEDRHSDGSGLTPTVHVMDQVQRQFVPDLLLVAAGDRVSFPNSDSIRHHVYSFSPTRADFNALVEALQLAMDDHQISISAQNRLLALLAPMHAEIVNR